MSRRTLRGTHGIALLPTKALIIQRTPSEKQRVHQIDQYGEEGMVC